MKMTKEEKAISKAHWAKLRETSNGIAEVGPISDAISNFRKSVCSADGCYRTEDCGPACRNRN